MYHDEGEDEEGMGHGHGTALLLFSIHSVDNLTTFMVIPCGWSSVSHFKGFKYKLNTV